MQVISVWLINRNTNLYTVYDNYTADAPVHAYFEDKNETHAMYHLTIAQNEAVKTEDYDAASISGYAEGYLTYKQINMFVSNALKELNVTAAMLEHIAKQFAFIDERGTLTAKMMKAWHWGLYQGYSHACELNKLMPYSREKLWAISSIMDMEDLQPLFGGDLVFKDRPTHCTGMAIPGPNLRDVFFSHVSWNSYQSGFIRIMKHYTFQWSLGNTIKQDVHFSSYPGQLSSVDDYYIVQNHAKNGTVVHLAILETTYGVKNQTIYDEVILPANRDGAAVMTWVRVMGATLSSTNAAEWFSEFKKDASWTYNNNYLFLDYAQYNETISACAGCSTSQLREHLLQHPDILQSLEVVPPSSLPYESAAVVPLLFSGVEYMLDNGFFISMNTPINMSLFSYLGYDPEDAYYGFNNSARLNISQHLAHGVSDFDAFKRFMRYNDYTSKDNFQKNDSGDGISARYDLRDETYANISIHGPSQFGATDCKATSLQMALAGEFEVIVGHTRGEFDYPVYRFSEHPEIDVQGVADVLPAVWDVQHACGGIGFAPRCQGCLEHYNITELCQKCDSGFQIKNGKCEEYVSDTAFIAIVASISVVIAVGTAAAVAFAVYYARKKGLVRITAEEKYPLNAEVPE